MNKNNNQLIVYFAWLLSAAVLSLSIFSWGSNLNWQFSNLSLYGLFPLLGLLAFSLMWTHYIVGAGRRVLCFDKKQLKTYFSLTGWAVLILILLHPLLLWMQLYRDGFGLPPSSYLNNYVAPTLHWAAILGTFGLVAFLAFETKHWFNKKGWWPVVEYVNVIAMFAIIIHGLALGSNLQYGWLRTVWFFYAITLLASVIYIYHKQTIIAKKKGELMKKSIGIILVFIVIIGGGVFAYTQLTKEDEQPATQSINETTSTSQNSSSDSSEKVFSVEEVKAHNTETDCWTIISGSVYDITDYVSRHPGGSEILRACGEDGTTLFTERKDESGNSVGSGTAHSSSAASQLANFKIGTVSQ